MNKWHPYRANVYEDTFLPSLEAAGVSAQQWDKVAPAVEESICGCSDAKLDKEYPPWIADKRLILTEEAFGVPQLRVAFLVNGEGKIVYLYGSPR